MGRLREKGKLLKKAILAKDAVLITVHDDKPSEMVGFGGESIEKQVKMTAAANKLYARMATYAAASIDKSKNKVKKEIKNHGEKTKNIKPKETSTTIRE